MDQLAETAARGHPARSEPLPMTLDGVTPEWLAGLLRLQYPGLEILAMQTFELISGHSTKLRLEVDFNEAGKAAGLPRDLCLKANWSGNPMSSPVCVNEARFYRQFRNKMELPAPSCYFADWDDTPTHQQGVILLDDIAKEGGTFVNSTHPIGLDDMQRSLTGLAELHGRTWNHPELHRQAWLQTAMAPETVTDDYWGMMETYFAAHNAIPERVAIFPAWMAKNPENLRTAWRQLCAQEMASSAPLCLVHGDSHLGNTYRRADGKRMWFDWQIVRKGRLWRDYSYFLIGSISIDDRRHAERDLLRHYCAALETHGVKLDFAEAWENYRRWVIWGLVAWQSNINPREETMQPLERFCVAATELDTIAFFSL